MGELSPDGTAQFLSFSAQTKGRINSHKGAQFAVHFIVFGCGITDGFEHNSDALILRQLQRDQWS